MALKSAACEVNVVCGNGGIELRIPDALWVNRPMWLVLCKLNTMKWKHLIAQGRGVNGVWKPRPVLSLFITGTAIWKSTKWMLYVRAKKLIISATSRLKLYANSNPSNRCPFALLFSNKTFPPFSAGRAWTHLLLAMSVCCPNSPSFALTYFPNDVSKCFHKGPFVTTKRPPTRQPITEIPVQREQIALRL